jgi:hypothetical protein
MLYKIKWNRSNEYFMQVIYNYNGKKLVKIVLRLSGAIVVSKALSLNGG